MIEWRIVCAGHETGNGRERQRHAGHAYRIPDRHARTPDDRHAFADIRNDDPSLRTVAYAGCWPYRIESRHVGPWHRDPNVADDCQHAQVVAESIAGRAARAEPADQPELGG